MDEKSYELGLRQAYGNVLRESLRHLGYGKTPEQCASWIAEREEAISQLRTLCEHYGDNDWTEDLNLSDIIEKHLARHLWSRENS